MSSTPFTNIPVEPIGVDWSLFGLFFSFGINFNSFWPVNPFCARLPGIKLYSSDSVLVGLPKISSGPFLIFIVLTPSGIFGSGLYSKNPLIDGISFIVFVSTLIT